jgi:hypothetical protein
MVKSLPYLPTKASMSFKRRISLKPRRQSQLASILFCTNNINSLTPGAIKTTGISSQYAPPTIIFCDSQSVHDFASSELNPRFCQNTQKVGHKQATCFTDENLYFDGKALPYLPSCETSDTHANLPSRKYRLKPRPTSNQILTCLQ